MHQARIYRASFRYRPAVLRKERRTPRHYSWGEFYDGLKRCTFGVRLWSNAEFAELLGKLEGMARARQARQMYEVFIVELERRLLLAPDSLPGAGIQ